ncbi:hypothetical protein B0H12DRAFT_1079625 [Mycena haematopus]|nr:hypothetical protein B0H12DRAFT_1079625 [Mycena haematopus]
MLTGEYNLNLIPREFHSYNLVHPSLKRLNIASFVVIPPVGAPVDALSGVIAAEQVQLYAVHNMRLNDPELDIDYNPAGYRAFANFLNQYDKSSGFYWSYWSDVEHRIKDPARVAANPLVAFGNVTEFLVRESDIHPRPMLRDGHIEVAKAWYDHIIESEQRRLVSRQRNIRESQKARENSAGLRSTNLDSAASRARVAQKRALAEEAFQEAHKRRHLLDAEEGELDEDHAPAEAPVAPLAVSPIIHPSASTDNSSINEATTSGASAPLVGFGHPSTAASSSGHRSPSLAASTIYVGSSAGSVAAMSPYISGNVTPYQQPLDYISDADRTILEQMSHLDYSTNLDELSFGAGTSNAGDLGTDQTMADAVSA